MKKDTVKKETTCINIDALLDFEEYIPILTDEEQQQLLTTRPTLMQLRDWNKRMEKRTADMDDIFSRAYKRAIHNNSNDNENGKGTRAR